MAAVESALTEVTAQLEKVAPIVEGLRDFQRLNLQVETQAEITDALAVYLRRVGLLDAAKAALSALMADGPADLPNQEISDVALKDLQDNRDTIGAALGQFRLEIAGGLGLISGPAKDK